MSHTVRVVPRTARVGVRLCARAVDFTAVLAIVSVGSLMPGASESSTATAVSFSLVAVGVSIAEACLLRWWGRTPGKAMLGLQVVTTNGQHVSFLRAFVRATFVWVTIMLGGIVAGIAGLVILAIGLTSLTGPMILREDHRGMHDLITGTTVTLTVQADRSAGNRRRRPHGT